MKHIHFVIYRLKSIIYSKIKFIKPSFDVEIQQKTITFTKGYGCYTAFINKIINSGIMRMFIFFYNYYIYIFCIVSQVLCISPAGYFYGFSMRNIFYFIVMILFFLYLIILMRYWHCI
jgi:hypothetical protein